MDKIKIEDLAHPPGNTGKIKKAGDIRTNKNSKEKIPVMGMIKKIITNSSLKKIMPLLKKLNIYREVRESLVAFYLSKTVAVKKQDLTISWQPPFFIFLKIAVVAFISFKLYELHPVVGTWLKTGLDFFKLHEIYNFKFPAKSFFDTVAHYIFLFIIGYYGIYFLYHQILGLFSVLVINKVDEKVYYIKNFFVKKDLFIFSIPDIALVILKQNIISRLFGLGTISLQKRSGEQVVIRTVQRAHVLLKDLTKIKEHYKEYVEAEE